MPKHSKHRFSTGAHPGRLWFYSELHSHYRDHMIFTDKSFIDHTVSFFASSVDRAGCLSRVVLDCAPVVN